MAQVRTTEGKTLYCGRGLQEDGTIRVLESLKGATVRNKHDSWLVDISGGVDTITVTGLIPAGAIGLILVARVTTTIAGGDGIASWRLGDSDDDHFGAALALTAGTTVLPTAMTAAATFVYTAAADVTIKGTAGKLMSSGQVRIEIWYSIATAPTS